MNAVPLWVVLLVLAGCVTWYNISNRRRKEKERLTPEAFFPENYIPPEGRGTDVNATFKRLFAYARTKGCIGSHNLFHRGTAPDNDGDVFLDWPESHKNKSFKEFLEGNLADGPGGNSLLIKVWVDMSTSAELAVIEEIDRLDHALNHAAAFWFKHGYPDLYYRNERKAGKQIAWVSFNVQAGKYAHERLNLKFMTEVIRRRDLLQQAEDQRVAVARRQAAELGEDIRSIALDQ